MRLGLPLLLLCATAYAGETVPKDWLGFPAYPGAKPLCPSERVYGNSMEIHWQSHTSTDAVEKVLAYYEKERGKAALKQNGKSYELRDKANNDLILSIHPATEPGYPSCGKKPAQADKTVILVSIAYRKSK
jgi:hypothetical protein